MIVLMSVAHFLSESGHLCKPKESSTEIMRDMHTPLFELLT